MSFYCKVNTLFCIWQNLFHAHFATFGSFHTASHCEDVRIEAGGFGFLLTFAFESETHEAVHKFVERHTCGFPKVERQRAGDGVDFVDIDIAGVGVDHHVYPAHAVTSEHAESLARKMAYTLGLVGRQVGRYAFFLRLHAAFVFSSTHILLTIIEEVAALDRLFENRCLILVAVAKNRAVYFLKILHHFFHDDTR